MAKIKITAADALKELSRLAEEFKKMKASASSASTKSAEDLKKLEDRIKKLNSIIGKLSKQMTAYETRMNKQQQTTSKTKKAYDALLKSLEANSRELRRNTAAQRSSRIATDKNTAAVNKQNDATRKAARNNKQLANSQVELTNNNKTMFSGLKSLTKAFGVIAGLTIFKNIALEAFETIKTFDRLKFTMEAITNTSFEIAESQVFLSGITEKFGLNIIDTTQSYIKFLAASKQAEFSVQKTQEIFESTSKAIAILGLGVDDSRSVFLALEQMISKGRVSTEELRRQLGEKLPGAFGIMASALGVTLPQLDDMLKKGEVLSAEVLPKFAVALENAYGTEAIDKVDTLVASQNRLTNAWITFQNILAEGKVSKIIKETLNEWAELINSISKSFAQPAKLLDIETKEAVEVQKKLLDKTSKEILDKRQKTGKSSIELDKQIAKATASLKASLTKEEQKVEQDKLDELLRQRSEYNKKLDKFNAERAEKRIQGVVDELRVEEDKLNKLIEFNKKAEAEGKDVQLFGVIPTGITKEEFKEQEKALDNQIKLVAQLRAELIVLRKASEKVKVTPLTPKVSDTKIDTSDLDLAIARLKIAAEVFKKISEDEEQELETRLDANKQYYEKLGQIIEVQGQKRVRLAKGNKNKLKQIEEETNFALGSTIEKGLENNNAISLSFIRDGAAKIRAAREDEANVLIAQIKQEYVLLGRLTKEQEEQLANEIAEAKRNANNEANQQQADFIKEQLDNLAIFGEERVKLEQLINKLLAGIQTENDAEQLENKKAWIAESIDLIHEFAESVGSIYDALLERRIENINAEIEAESAKYDELIRLAGDDAAQKAALEEEKEKKLEKLRAKRLKAEQQQAKFQKALAIADIAVKLGQTIVAHNLAAATIDATTLGIGGQFYRAIEIPLSVALAAAQTAAVLASPIPKFATGVDNLSQDTKAIINDGGKQEFVERGNKILTTTTKDALVDLHKGDTVYRDFDDMAARSKVFDSAEGLKATNIKTYNNNPDLEGAIKRGFKGVDISNNIIIKSDSDQNSYRQDLSNWN